MRLSFSPIVTYSLILLASCSQEKAELTFEEPQFAHTENIQGIGIGEPLELKIPQGLAVGSNSIYVLSVTGDKAVHAYDKSTGEKLGEYVSIGEGPGEVSGMPSDMELDDSEGTLTVYDTQAEKAVVMSVREDGSLAFKEEKSLVLDEGVMRHAWMLGGKSLLIDGQAVMKSDGQMGRYQILDGGTVVSEYGEFPVPEFKSAFMNNVRTELSPDRSKMVVCTLYGGIMETFSLKNGKIKLQRQRGFYPIIADSDGSMFNIMPNDNTVYGFSSVCSTNDQIYTVLIGGKDASVFNRIAVFDWNANPVKEYVTDKNAMLIAADPKDESHLYAIVFEPESGFNLCKFVLL